MEGTDNNKCLPANLWMSQVDPQFSGNLGSSSLRDARTMSSPTHLDLSRKQPPSYSDYDMSSMHYKQNATSSVMQQDFPSQSLSQPVTTTSSRYSQPVHGYTLEHNAAQLQDRHFSSQPHRGYTSESLPQQSVGSFMSQNTQQPGRGQLTHNMQQQNARPDRSVWSHLYSLDPSIASYGMTGQSAQNTNLNQDKPYSYTLPRTEGASNIALNMSSVPTEKPPLILGKATSSEQLSSSYMNRGPLPADDIPISSLDPTLYSNALGNTNAMKQKSSVSYEEEIGGYSPVSPPAHEMSSSPFSDLPSDRNAVLSMKNDSFMMSYSVSDFSSSSKALPVNQFVRSNPTVSDSNVLQFSHDVPLDMTKGWSSQNADRTPPALITCSSDIRLSQPVPQNSYSYSIPKEIISNQHSDMPDNQFAANQSREAPSVNRFATNNPSDIFSGNPVTMSKTDTLSANNPIDLLSANPLSTSKPTDTFAANQFSANQPSEISSDNQFAVVNESSAEMRFVDEFTANNSVDLRPVNPLSSKPADRSAANQIVSNEPTETSSANSSNISQKIVAPKKSNFYGRDASFFSVPEVSDQASHISPVDNSKSTAMSRNENTVASGNVKFDPLLSHTDSNLGLNQTLCNAEVKMSVNNESLLQSNIEPNSTSFADSFIDATTAPSPNGGDKVSSENQKIENVLVDEKKEESFKVASENMEIIREDSANDELTLVKQNNGSGDCPDNVGLKIETDNLVISEHQPTNSLEEDLTTNFEIPNTLVTTRGGKAPRGRKRRGGAAQRRQTKRGGKKTPVFEAEIIEGGVDSGVSDSGVKGVNDADINMETDPSVITLPAPKTRARRGRKRSFVETVNSDSEGSMTRRSSSRRSKDNAMRLIELQAESIYGHVAKPVAEEPPVEKEPPKPRRKAAKAAVKSSTFSDTRDDEDLIEEKDISSDEVNDDKDADYAVDEEDVEAMEKDELLDLPKDQKRPVVEKKSGGLKISIKLGLDPSAEIVSGIDKSPPRKKKKVAKKAKVSQKFKSKAIIQDVDLEDDDTEDVKKVEKKTEVGKRKVDSDSSELKGNDKEAVNEVEEKGDVVDKHISLMDKYFSSATQARPAQKPASKKDNQVKNASTKSKTSKTVKGPKTNTVSSSHLINDGVKPTTDSISTPDTGVPKFVCGYCPNRYHNKQELLSHMEGHMAEMEDKPSKTPGGDSTGGISKEPKKPSPSSKKSDSSNSASPKAGKKGDGSEALKYNCGECGKSFSSKPNLLDHVRTHAAEKPFECNLCHKFFKERDQLSVHRKVHVQEGLLRCQFCQKGFVNNADLTSHMESHPKRTKSAQSKHPLSDPVKKANPISDSTKKILDPPKKVLKTQQVSREKDVVPQKPKSFASALEPSLEKNKDNPTLLLRRKDGSASSSKDESLKIAKPSKQEVTPSKFGKDEVNKKSSLKAQDVKKDSKELPSGKKEMKETPDVRKVSKETKVVDEKPNNSNKASIPSNVNKEEKDKSVPGECACQECPECVTRFLNSFE